MKEPKKTGTRATDQSRVKPKESNPDILKLANRIKQLRIKKGYSNYEFFAYDHHISRAQYGRYEKGEDIRYTSLVRLAKAFDISLKDFFSEGFE